MRLATKHQRIVWLVLALPALVQLFLLLYTVLSRLAYPYDLEWMEGGLLTHVERIAAGQGIYVEPSVDFIPYLYTPLYPGLLAILSIFTGLHYQLGRIVSLLSIAALIFFFVHEVRSRHRDKVPRVMELACAATAVGLFSATYPWVEGWYDLVRADTLFMAMAIGGLIGVRKYARTEPGAIGHAQIASAAAVLALSFFAKQTGIFFVATGGLLLLLTNWRRVPIFIAVSGAIGLGFTWLLDRTSNGWFWTYVFEIHQSHDFNFDRLWASIGNVLWHFPGMSVVIGVALLLVAVTGIRTRTVGPDSRSFLQWALVFAISAVLGAISYATQFAHFNAYIPAMTTGAIATGLAILSIAESSATLAERTWIPQLAASAACCVLAVQLATAWWAPSRFIPTKDDLVQGNALVSLIGDIEGEVFVPFHPWYGRLAGKRTFVHRMGVIDVSTGKHPRPVRELREAFATHRFDAIVLDNRPTRREFPGLEDNYRIDQALNEMAPRVYTGAGRVGSKPLLRPDTLWVPAKEEAPPEGVVVLGNFEDGSYGTWKVTGKAFGTRPVHRRLPKQGNVRQFGGRYYATSFHGGDESVGTLLSPTFTVTVSHMTFKISGGADKDRLRVNLKIGNEVVRSTTGRRSETMREEMWSLASYNGQQATIEVIDDSRDAWGHLNVDEFWLWE